VLSHQFRELTQYLHAFNDMQLETLGAESSRGDVDTLLRELVARFVDEEYARRFQRQRRLDDMVVREQPHAQVRQAAAAARSLAGQLMQRGAAPLTAAEALPLAVFFEQLAMRLDVSAAAIDPAA
jgi:hypothetical protein